MARICDDSLLQGFRLGEEQHARRMPGGLGTSQMLTQHLQKLEFLAGVKEGLGERLQGWSYPLVVGTGGGRVSIWNITGWEKLL